MKRKKIISGTDDTAKVTITIEIEASLRLSREESQRMMDALAGQVMTLYQHAAIPFLNVPLVRLAVR